MDLEQVVADLESPALLSLPYPRGTALTLHCLYVGWPPVKGRATSRGSPHRDRPAPSCGPGGRRERILERRRSEARRKIHQAARKPALNERIEIRDGREYLVTVLPEVKPMPEKKSHGWPSDLRRVRSAPGWPRLRIGASLRVGAGGLRRLRQQMAATPAREATMTIAPRAPRRRRSGPSPRAQRLIAGASSVPHHFPTATSRSPTAARVAATSRGSGSSTAIASARSIYIEHGLQQDPPVEDGRRCLDADELHRAGLAPMSDEEMWAPKRNRHRAGFSVSLWFDPADADRLRRSTTGAASCGVRRRGDASPGEGLGIVSTYPSLYAIRRSSQTRSGGGSLRGLDTSQVPGVIRSRGGRPPTGL